MHFPRLIYFGPPTAEALTKRINTLSEFTEWAAKGWRLTRQGAPQCDEEPVAALDVTTVADVSPTSTAPTEPLPQTDSAPPDVAADALKPAESEPSNRRRRR